MACKIQDFIKSKSTFQLKIVNAWVLSMGHCEEVDGVRHYFKAPWSFAVKRNPEISKSIAVREKQQQRRRSIIMRGRSSFNDLTDIRSDYCVTILPVRDFNLVIKLRNATQKILDQIQELDFCYALDFPPLEKVVREEDFKSILLSGDVEENPGPFVGCNHLKRNWEYHQSISIAPKKAKWSYFLCFKQSEEISMSAQGVFNCDYCNERWFRVLVKGKPDDFQNAAKVIRENPGFAAYLETPWNNRLKEMSSESDYQKDLTEEGIEPNPGPVSVLRSRVSTFERGDETSFVLPNGKSFFLSKKDFEYDGHLIIFNKVTKRVHDELVGMVSQDSEFLQNLEGKPITVQIDSREVPLIRSTIWSDHVDFDPDKRLNISFSSKFVREMEMNDLSFIMEKDSEGRVFRFRNFYLLPKDGIKIKFSKRIYNHQNTNHQLYQRIRASIMNQQMTKEQIVKMAANLTVLQMTYLQYPEDRESVFGLFSILFDKEICYLMKYGPSQNNIHSVCDLWECLFEARVYIPTGKLSSNQKISDFAVLESEGEFLYSRDHFMKIASSRFNKLNFPETAQELVEKYKNGHLTLFNNLKPFALCNNVVFQPIQTTKLDDLTDLERAIIHLVEDRMHEDNIIMSVHRMLDYAVVRCSFETVKKIVKKLSSYDIVAAFNPGLQRAFKKPSKPLTQNWPELSYDQVEFVKKVLHDERIIATSAQAEFQTWCAFFGQPTQKKYFNNTHYIKGLSLLRRGMPALKMMSTIKAPFKAASNFLSNVSTIASNATNISENLNGMKESFVTAMNNRNMVGMAKALNEIKFESFKDSFNSLKIIVNAWFSDFAERICDLFGVDYSTQIDATKLLFYYIVWQHTDSFPLQIFIVSEVLLELGVFDFVMTVVKKMALAFRDLFKPVEKGLNEKQQEALKRMRESRIVKSEELDQKISQTIRETVKPAEHQEDTDLISNVITFLSEASPVVLGIAGTILISCLGLTPFTQNKPGQCFGEKIVQSTRNISFLSLGIIALPKIYENIIKIVYGVIDYAKEIFCENHTSSVTYHKQVEQWLKKAIYSETASKSHFVNSLDAIITYFQCYGEMQELRKRSTEIKSALLMQLFEKRCVVMENLYQVALSAGRIMLGNREVFHIQLFSHQGGVGKTDTATNMLGLLKTQLTDYENKLRGTMGLKPSKTPSFLADVYPLKETLKHADMYFGQKFGYIDEDLVNTDVDADVVLDKMTLLSGFVAISQQAALGDKGRIFELAVLISNTNNPKLPIKGMVNPSALFRRRHLIQVEIKPEAAKMTKDANNITIAVVDDEKCKALGLDRSKGDHLLFTVCDPLTAEPAVDEVFIKMDMEGFVQWSVEKMQEHFVREDNRLFTKSPATSLARLQFDSLIQDLKVAYGGIPQNCTFETIRESLATMRTFINEKAPEKPEFKKFLLRKAQDCENVSNIEPMSSSTAKLLYGVKEKSLENVDYEFVTFKEVDERGVLTDYVSLIDSKNQTCAESGGIDFTGFKWSKKHDRVCYAGIYPQSIVAYWLVMFKNTVNAADFEARRKIFVAQQNDASLIEQWKLEIKNIHYSTYRAVESCTKWILSKTIDMMNGPIMQGIAMAVAITAMFFGLRIIGSLLSPQDKAYSTKADKRIVKMKALETSFDQDIELAKKSIYRIKIHDERGETEGNIIGVEGTIFLVNAHVIGKEGLKQISIYDPSIGAVNPEYGWKTFEISSQHISFIPNCDAALIDTRGYRPTKRVINHFLTEEDLRDDMTNFHTGHHSVVTVDRKRETLRLMTTGFYPGHPHQQYTGAKYHKRVLRIQYDQEIPGGWSGSLVLHANPKISSKFIGIVLSQDAFHGIYVGVVSREEIKKAAEKFPSSSRIITPDKDLPQLKSSHRLYDVFDLKENLFESPIRSQAVSESLGFIPTQIHGVMPVETQPAIQHVKDPRIPSDARHFLQVSLNKTNGYHEPSYTLREEKFMKDFLRDTYVRYVPQVSQVKTLSTQDAIKGVRLMGSTSMNTKSSAGLPYKLEKGVVGKSPFIRFNDQHKSWEIQQRVFEDVERYERLYHEGRTPNEFKMEFRKKELVGINKIENPKTRTVATGNFINQIVYDKNFKDLYRLVKNVWENGGTSPFALGVDPERHWDQIANHLKYTDYVIDFDVKAWEEKVCLPLLMLTADVKVKLIEEAYRSRGQKPPNIRPIVEGLAVDYTDTFVVFEDMVYRKKSGLLSGHPGTFMENSEIHEVILALLIYRILREKAPSYATVQFIQEHVRSIKAADDIQIALSPLARRIITITDIVEGYKTLGFELTAADKGTNMKFKRLEDSQFLKNGFKLVEGEYQCLPSKSIIYQLLNWMRTDTALSYNEQFDVNIQNAFRFLFWYGEDEYEATREIVNHALLPYSRSWPLSYEEMRAIMKLHLQESESAAHSYIPAEQEEEF